MARREQTLPVARRLAKSKNLYLATVLDVRCDRDDGLKLCSAPNRGLDDPTYMDRATKRESSPVFCFVNLSNNLHWHPK